MRTGATVFACGNAVMGVLYWITYEKIDGVMLWLAVSAVFLSLIALRIVRDRELERAEKFFMTAPDEYGFALSDEQTGDQEAGDE